MISQREPRSRDYSPRDFDVGGAAGSLYEIFADLGRVVFIGLIGLKRAKLPALRNARVLTGGALSLALLAFAGCGFFQLLNAIFKKGPQSDDGVCIAMGLFGAAIGAVLGHRLIWYVERARDEVIRGDWLNDLGPEDKRSEMESAVDGLAPITRGRYYDEYYAARDRGQPPSEAHATARRRCK